ncbi:MAG: hypothetical protein ACSHXD_17140 [Marinosulfonomonas sp.]
MVGIHKHHQDRNYAEYEVQCVSINEAERQTIQCADGKTNTLGPSPRMNLGQMKSWKPSPMLRSKMLLETTLMIFWTT